MTYLYSFLMEFIRSTDFVPWNGILLSTITTIAFNRASKFMRDRRLTIPVIISSDEYLSWRWLNVLLSLIHSLFSGLWTVYCVLNQPLLMTDMVSIATVPAYRLVSFSLGYFVYDLIEMVMNINYKGCLELIVHHVFVISCLLISVTDCRYLGFACIALSVELSNIFLHSRTLMKIAHVDSFIFSIHRWINLAFFVIFRLLVLFFLLIRMFEYQSLVPSCVFFAGILCGAVVLVISSFLLYRLLLSDFNYKY